MPRCIVPRLYRKTMRCPLPPASAVVLFLSNVVLNGRVSTAGRADCTGARLFLAPSSARRRLQRSPKGRIRDFICVPRVFDLQDSSHFT